MATPFVQREVVLLAKTETTEGTDPTPTPAANAVLVLNPVSPSIPADDIDRDIAIVGQSPLGTTVGLRHGEVTFGVEIRGMGVGPAVIPTAAAPLKEHPLLYACGLSPTYAANSSSAIYAPFDVGGTVNTCTIYGYFGGVLRRYRACRGNVRWLGEVGRPGRAEFAMRGVFDPVSSNPDSTTDDIRNAANPTPTYLNRALKPPSFIGATMSAHGYAGLHFRTMELDAGNQIERDESANAASGIIGFLQVGRAPTGRFDPKMITRIAAFDVYRRWEQGDEGVIVWQFGATAGNRVIFSAPKAQLQTPTDGERTGIRTWDLGFRCNRNSDAGNDEYTITFS